MLVHHTYSPGDGVTRRRKGDLFSPYADLAAVRGIISEEDVHESRFAGAVFAEQCADLSLP